MKPPMLTPLVVLSLTAAMISCAPPLIGRRATAKHYLYGIHSYAVGAERIFNGKPGYSVEYIPESSSTIPRSIPGVIDKLLAQGITPILRIDYRQGQTMPATVAEQDQFAAECAAIAAAYAGRVRIYVIGNEMNLTGEGYVTSDAYAAGFKTVRAAIRVHQSDALVLVGPPGPWFPTNPDLPSDQTPDFYSYRAYQTALVRKIGDECDGYAIHAYGGRGGDENPYDDGEDGFGAFRAQAERIDAAYAGAAGKPIFITEFDHAASGHHDELRSTDSGTFTVHVPNYPYPAGFINEAYRAVDDWNRAHGYQIKALCWFVYAGTPPWTDWQEYALEKNAVAWHDFSAMTASADYASPLDGETR